MGKCYHNTFKKLISPDQDFTILLTSKVKHGEQSLHTDVAHISMRMELACDTTQIAHIKRTDILYVMIYLHGHV